MWGCRKKNSLTRVKDQIQSFTNLFSSRRSLLSFDASQDQEKIKNGNILMSSIMKNVNTRCRIADNFQEINYISLFLCHEKSLKIFVRLLHHPFQFLCSLCAVASSHRRIHFICTKFGSWRMAEKEVEGLNETRRDFLQLEIMVDATNRERNVQFTKFRMNSFLNRLKINVIFSINSHKTFLTLLCWWEADEVFLSKNVILDHKTIQLLNNVRWEFLQQISHVRKLREMKRLMIKKKLT